MLYLGNVNHHEIYYFCLILVWFVVVIVIEPYNYDRFNFWQRVIILGVTCNAMLMLIYSFVEGSLVAVVIVQLCIVALFGLVGLQKKIYPSMLYRNCLLYTSPSPRDS